MKFCQKKILSVKNKGYPAGHRLKIKDNSAGHWDRWPPTANFGPNLPDQNREPPRKSFPFIWSKNGGNRLVLVSFGRKTKNLR